MKVFNRFVFPVWITGLLFLCFSACQKDRLPVAETVAGDPSADEFAYYDEFGPKLEEAFSYAVADREFVADMFDLAGEMRDGDTEFLLTELFQTSGHAGVDPKSHLLKYADGLFTVDELNKFTELYPNIIVGVRGPNEGWAHDESYVPAVRFVESTYDQKEKTSYVIQEGTKVNIDMTKPLENVIFAIHPSERHTKDGTLVQVMDNSHQTRQATAQPGTSLGDLGMAQKNSMLCGPEPSSCSGQPTPTFSSFTAVPENGGIKLTYTANNFPSSLCRWGRVKITRYGPSGAEKTWRLYADQINFMYDFSGNLNFTYTYKAEIYIAYNGPSLTTPGGIQWFTCKAPLSSSERTASATYPAGGPVLSSYVGKNVDANRIRYDWSPPAGIPVQEYRIRKATSTGYTTVASGIPASQNYYFYQIPSGLGIPFEELIETQIQFKSGGTWQGNFYDKTYNSYRSPGMPFKFYGIKVPDPGFYDVGENLFNGAPEIRLLALQGNANESSNILARTVIQMSNCITWHTSPSGSSYWRRAGLYYPYGYLNGFTILNSWNPDIYGTAIRIDAKETDSPEIVVTSVVNTTEGSFSTNIGFKAAEGLNLGVASSYKTGSSVTYRYPIGDIDLGNSLIYYHDSYGNGNFIANMLYGNVNSWANEPCERLNLFFLLYH